MMANIYASLENVQNGAHAKANRASLAIPSIPLPPIARDRLISGCWNQPQFVMSLMNEFVTSSRDQLSRLTVLVRKRKYSEIAEVAHALRGAAEILCAAPMSGIAADLETAAKAADLPETRRMVELLQIELDRCVIEVREIEHYFQNLSPETSPTSAQSST